MVNCTAACASDPRLCRWKAPTSARSNRRGWQSRLSSLSIDVSFISLKLVLPAVRALLAPVARLAGADQAAIRSRSRATSRKASCATRRCMPRSATRSRAAQRRSAFAWSAHSSHRSSAATATANFSSVLLVTERLVIERIGRHGDGIADSRRRRRCYVPYTLPGEIVEVDAWPGDTVPATSHTDRAGERRAHRADLPAFRRSAAAARLQHWERERYRAWKRDARGRGARRRPASTRRSTN